MQASTRYIDYQHGFEYIVPAAVRKNDEACAVYNNMMQVVQESLRRLDALGIPREDSAMGLPLGMTTRIVCKHNARNLIDMSHQRLCARAYHEYRRLFSDVCSALSAYSEEWAYLVKHYFIPKCKYMGFCKEKMSCGMMPRAEKMPVEQSRGKEKP